MFKKVLISDDLDSISQGVLNTLESLNISNIDKTLYCDDAYLKLKKGYLDKNPYQLFITDLSFIADHREQKFNSGKDLINTLTQEHPDLKIIVYSIEDRLENVKQLYSNNKVSAYVCKGRNGLKDLKDAILQVYNNKTYLSPSISDRLKSKNHLEITNYDIELLKLLSVGLSQDEISTKFKQKNISPSSLSSIEKKINKLKLHFNAQNTIHLVSITKDTGLI